MDKNTRLGYLTAILHLAPAKLSVQHGGFNTCPDATPQCSAVCLNTAGRGGIPTPKMRKFLNPIQKARVERTLLFHQNRPLFWTYLIQDINLHMKRARKRHLNVALRLNGTSDIPWEKIPVLHSNGVTVLARSIMELYPTIRFYDYTKTYSRMFAPLPANYHLTFSRSETTSDDQVQSVLIAGKNVAVVYGTPRGWALPYTDSTYRTVILDGDLHDLRFADLPGLVVGLRAKGKARTFDGGFVKYA